MKRSLKTTALAIILASGLLGCGETKQEIVITKIEVMELVSKAYIDGLADGVLVSMKARAGEIPVDQIKPTLERLRINYMYNVSKTTP